MRWWLAFLVSVALCMSACSGIASVDGAHDHSIESHAEVPVPQEATSDSVSSQPLTLVATEVTEAQVEFGETWLGAELARDNAHGSQRAEGVWGIQQDSAGEPVRLTSGQVTEVSFTSTLDLGGVEPGGVWAVHWQLVGPDEGLNWPGPPLVLTVNADQWRVGGGQGHPSGSREAYVDTGVPFRNGQAIDWRIRVVLERGGGTVDLWADGTKVVDEWRPPGGTMYPRQPYVLMKTGLYTGGQGGDGQRFSVSIVDAGGAVHYGLPRVEPSP